jgi:hypothetical protein
MKLKPVENCKFNHLTFRSWMEVQTSVNITSFRYYVDIVNTRGCYFGIFAKYNMGSFLFCRFVLLRYVEADCSC